MKHLIAAILLLSSAVAASAQSGQVNGSIRGTVLDHSGAVVPNASTKVKNLDTGFERNATTNDRPLYRGRNDTPAMDSRK